MKKYLVSVSALTALMFTYMTQVTQARAQGTAGSCLAVADNLPVPVLVIVQDTNGTWPNGSMNEIQVHANGYQDFPWVVQPGGTPEMLVYGQGQGYLKSQNGQFGITAGRMMPSTDPTQSVQISNDTTTGYATSVKLVWAFHSEMTVAGNCNGTWLVTIGE